MITINRREPQPMKTVALLSLVFISLSCLAAPEDDFVITVKTDEPITFNPTRFEITTSGGGYNYNVDCNDDGVDEATAQTGDYTCEYAGMGGAGTYTIRIKDNSGSGVGFPRIINPGESNSRKIMSLNQWGTGQWTSMANAFSLAHNMVVLATDIPDLSLVTDMSEMFLGSDVADPDVSNWDVSLVTNMGGMFSGASLADPDVSNWDVSSVTNMSLMFTQASLADPDVSNWDVSSVTYMIYMFQSTGSANPDVGSASPDVSLWDVSSVTDMTGMFNQAYSANPDVSLWDVSSVTSMESMFANAVSSTPNVDNWDVSSVTSMKGMFAGATSATPNVDNWDVSSVIDMSRMFLHARLSDPDVSNWDVSSVTDMSRMFLRARLSDPDVSGWDVSSVTSMESMFEGATSAIPHVDNWDVSSVTSMFEMFKGVTLPPWLYDAILVNFSEQTLESEVPFDAGDSYYCNGLSSRTNIVNTYGWVIEDGGLNCGSDVSVEFVQNNQLFELGQNNPLNLLVTNTGYQDVTDAMVTTAFSTGHANLRWTCQIITGLALCPTENGTGDLSESVELNENDQLSYVFNFDLLDDSELSATANIDLMVPEDDIYLQNNLSVVTNKVSKISKHTSGAWFDAENPGHGVFLEVLEGQENQTDRLNMYWFTYHDSKPIWVGGVGEIINGERVVIDLQITQGADFSPNFNAADVVAEDWGQVTMSFQGPHSVKLDWVTLPTHSEFGSGEINFTQLSTVSESIEGCYSGSFYNPNQPGHGFYIHVTDTSNNLKQVNVSWFTYHEGELFWLVGSGIFDQNDTNSIQLAQFTGASFFNPLAPNGWSFNADDLVNTNWGDLTLSFTNENNMNLSYQPHDSNQFESGELTVTRLTSMKGHSCN